MLLLHTTCGPDGEWYSEAEIDEDMGSNAIPPARELPLDEDAKAARGAHDWFEACSKATI